MVVTELETGTMETETMVAVATVGIGIIVTECVAQETEMRNAVIVTESLPAEHSLGRNIRILIGEMSRKIVTVTEMIKKKSASADFFNLCNDLS